MRQKNKKNYKKDKTQPNHKGTKQRAEKSEQKPKRKNAKLKNKTYDAAKQRSSTQRTDTHTPSQKKQPAAFDQSPNNKQNDKKPHHKSPPNPRLIYGVHATTEALLNPKRSIHRILASKNAQTAIKNVLNEATDKGLKRPAITIMDRYALDTLLPHGAVHQGIIVDAAPLDIPRLDTIIEKAKLFVILDQVTDPHNVGAILRSSAAFGADGFIVQDSHAPDITGILAKIACGDVEHTPILRETNLSRLIEKLKDHGFTCIGFDEHTDMTLADMSLANMTITSTTEGQENRPEKIALVMGAEGTGLRQLVAKKCDFLVRLPTQGRIASLNVSNAAAIALYEIKR
jgi:23S rRNA (guanosine2251-2'-O)-methyltransferase